MDEPQFIRPDTAEEILQDVKRREELLSLLKSIYSSSANEICTSISHLCFLARSRGLDKVSKSKDPILEKIIEALTQLLQAADDEHFIFSSPSECSLFISAVASACPAGQLLLSAKDIPISNLVRREVLVSLAVLSAEVPYAAHLLNTNVHAILQISVCYLMDKMEKAIHLAQSCGELLTSFLQSRIARPSLLSIRFPAQFVTTFNQRIETIWAYATVAVLSPASSKPATNLLLSPRSAHHLAQVSSVISPSSPISPSSSTPGSIQIIDHSVPAGNVITTPSAARVSSLLNSSGSPVTPCDFLNHLLAVSNQPSPLPSMWVQIRSLAAVITSLSPFQDFLSTQHMIAMAILIPPSSSDLSTSASTSLNSPRKKVTFSEAPKKKAQEDKEEQEEKQEEDLQNIMAKRQLCCPKFYSSFLRLIALLTAVSAFDLDEESSRELHFSRRPPSTPLAYTSFQDRELCFAAHKGAITFLQAVAHTSIFLINHFTPLLSSSMASSPRFTSPSSPSSPDTARIEKERTEEAIADARRFPWKESVHILQIAEEKLAKCAPSVAAHCRKVRTEITRLSETVPPIPSPSSPSSSSGASSPLAYPYVRPKMYESPLSPRSSQPYVIPPSLPSAYTQHAASSASPPSPSSSTLFFTPSGRRGFSSPRAAAASLSSPPPMPSNVQSILPAIRQNNEAAAPRLFGIVPAPSSYSPPRRSVPSTPRR